MSKTGAVNLPAFKTSVKKSANKPPPSKAAMQRAAINKKAEGSPVLRRQKRKQSDELPDAPADKRMASNQDLTAALVAITSKLDKIDNGLKDNTTRDDVTKVQTSFTKINAQLITNTNNIAWLMRSREEDVLSTLRSRSKKRSASA